MIQKVSPIRQVLIKQGRIVVTAQTQDKPKPTKHAMMWPAIEARRKELNRVIG